MDRANPKVYAYTREQNGKKLLIALNFSKDAATFNAGYALGKATVLLGNYPSSSTDGTLKPFEAVVYQLND